MRDLQESHAKEENALRTQITKLQQERRQLQEAITQYQTNEHTQKQEFDQVLFRAQEMHEMLERETHEKFVSIAEQKSLRQQVENLSKNMKSLQVSLVSSFAHILKQGHFKTNKQTNTQANKQEQQQQNKLSFLKISGEDFGVSLISQCLCCTAYTRLC